MKNSYLLHHLIFSSSLQFPERQALIYQSTSLTYQELAKECARFSKSLIDSGFRSQERVAIFLEKRIEFVATCFGTSCAAGIFVPINPILKVDQVEHILSDSGARVLVTSLDRYLLLKEKLQSSKALLEINHIILVDSTDDSKESSTKSRISSWKQFMAASSNDRFENFSVEFSHRHMIDTDAVSILYTSGSTGRPKGVVLSHRNMVFGAKNVSSYLENGPEDRLLAVLPLSFDAGFSQLTTGFFSGACVVLLNYILPNDILAKVSEERITGLTAVPPLWIQIANLKWPQSVQSHLRYFANTGGRMPLEVLKKLRQHFPTSQPYLMYGLTESFRSTYLPPSEIDRRPDSIGKAIPNAEILILRNDGSPCGPREPGELVHRGALVGLGYWKDPEKTAERYKPLPLNAGCRPAGIINQEMAVFSGDVVEMDEEGFIYFIGRNDEMIKTSGYRVSPTEVEEIIYNSGFASEVAAFGISNEVLGQVIVVSIVPVEMKPSMQNSELKEKILCYCKSKVPPYLVPNEILVRLEPHPRNQNGKIDRKRVSQEFFDSKNKTEH